MSAILIDGQLAHYEVIGRGRPVLFIHGWVGSWRYWVPTMQTISPTHRAYALDLWGFGDSTKNNQYSLDYQTELIESFINKIGLSQISIIGHGLGAILAYKFALEFPDFVEKIMTVSLLLSLEMLNYRLLLSEPNGLVDKLLGKGMETEVVRIDEPKNDPNAVKINITELENINFIKPLNLFSKTTLLVYGKNDPVVRIPAPDQIQSFQSNVHTIIFDQSGHFPMLDESSKFSRLLSEFLELRDEDSPRNLQIKDKWQRRVR